MTQGAKMDRNTCKVRSRDGPDLCLGLRHLRYAAPALEEGSGGVRAKGGYPVHHSKLHSQIAIADTTGIRTPCGHRRSRSGAVGETRPASCRERWTSLLNEYRLSIVIRSLRATITMKLNL
jgi:hypothetical protein